MGTSRLGTDVDAFTDDYADDISGADPTHDDYGPEGEEATVVYWRNWAAVSDYTIDVTGMFVSAAGVAYEEA